MRFLINLGLLLSLILTAQAMLRGEDIESPSNRAARAALALQTQKQRSDPHVESPPIHLARKSVGHYTPAKRRVSIYDFSVCNIYTKDFSDPIHTVWNRTITCE